MGLQSRGILLSSRVMTKVEKAILRTLAFFDIFNRPMMLEEIRHYLYEIQASKLMVLLGLQNLQKKKIILEKNSYFCLINNRKILTSFEEQKTLCQKRWQKVNRVVKFLAMAPFVKNISIINSLAFGTSRKDSDIDILLITKKNRLWTARALVVVILEILGQNKNRWYQANKFCLGFAFDDERLNLDNLRLRPPAGGDIYFSFWLASLMPVFDRKIYQKLIEKNSWIFKVFPNWTAEEIDCRQEKKSYLEKILAGKFGDRLERFLANAQIKRIWSNPENLRPGASIIADGHMMKLHAYDKREEYRHKWQDLTKSVFLP